MKNDILSQPPGPAEQMGTVGICHHFFDRSKSKLGGQKTPNTKACPHLVWKCSARSGHLYVPSLAYLASFSLSGGQRGAAWECLQPVSLPRSAFLAQNVAAE